MPDYDVALSIEYEVDPSINEALLVAVVLRTLEIEAAPSGSVSLAITDDATVQALNRDFRQLDEPTDVLSFGLGGLAKPLEEEPRPDFVLPEGAPLEIGEIVLAYPYAERQAAQRAKPVRDEVALLVVHGVLHLLGHDHLEPDEEALMQARERAVLGEFGMERG